MAPYVDVTAVLAPLGLRWANDRVLLSCMLVVCVCVCVSVAVRVRLPLCAGVQGVYIWR